MPEDDIRLEEHFKNAIFNPENKNFYFDLNGELDSTHLFPQNNTISMQKSITMNLWYIQKNMLYTYVNSSENPNPFLGSTAFPDMLQTPSHRHAFIELAYIIKGTLHQEICGEQIIFQEGEICLINQNALHWDYIVPGNCMILFLSLQNTYFQHLLEKEIENSAFFTFLNELLFYKKETYQYLRFSPKGGDTMQTPELIRLLTEEIREKDLGYYQILSGTIIRLMSCLGKEFQLFLKKEDWKRFEKMLFEDIVFYIQNNYRDVTIVDLQKQFHYNEDYFNRIIKKYTCQTYQQLRQDIRLEHAKYLLETTSIPVDIISKQVGYENIGYFYRRFREKYGHTPGGLRKVKHPSL